MELVSTYIETADFQKSIEFYKSILNMEPNVFSPNRWVEFECGNKLSLYNPKYDEDAMKNADDVSENYNQAYIDEFLKPAEQKRNNIVTFNFYTSNLKEEYLRIKNLNLCEVSEIMYVNIAEPYYYFTISDPDGNVLEICGNDYEG